MNFVSRLSQSTTMFHCRIVLFFSRWLILTEQKLLRRGTNVYSRSLLHLEKRCTNTKLTVRSREDCDCTWRRTEDEKTVHQIFCHSRSKTKSETGHLFINIKPYKSSNKHNANILSHLIYPSFHFFSSDEWSSSTSLSLYCRFILYLR